MKAYLIFATVLGCTRGSTALALDPHVEAVTHIVEAAKGKVVKTEDGQSLTLRVDGMPAGGFSLMADQLGG